MGAGGFNELGRAMKFLVTGADGMLGRAWVHLLEREQLEFRKVTHPEFDLTDRGSIDSEVRDVDVVVNCAAWTDVDGAEEHEQEATAVNGVGVGWLAERCRQVDAQVVHYSTDYVFAGDQSTPYLTGDALHPINAYGRSKAAGERALRATHDGHLLIRTSWLYAPWGKNFVRTMARLGRERDEVSVVRDQLGRPTSALHLARASLALLRKKASGTFHVTDGGECTWYDLAALVIGRTNPSCQVKPCRSSEFPRPARRPSYSVLDLSNTEALVGRLSTWQENVGEVLGELAGKDS